VIGGVRLVSGVSVVSMYLRHKVEGRSALQCQSMGLVRGEWGD